MNSVNLCELWDGKSIPWRQCDWKSCVVCSSAGYSSSYSSSYYAVRNLVHRNKLYTITITPSFWLNKRGSHCVLMFGRKKKLHRDWVIHGHSPNKYTTVSGTGVRVSKKSVATAEHVTSIRNTSNTEIKAFYAAQPKVSPCRIKDSEDRNLRWMPRTPCRHRGSCPWIPSKCRQVVPRCATLCLVPRANRAGANPWLCFVLYVLKAFFPMTSPEEP